MNLQTVEVVIVAKFISTSDWSEYITNGLIANGIVPEEEVIMFIIDLTLDFFHDEGIIDYTMEIE